MLKTATPSAKRPCNHPADAAEQRRDALDREQGVTHFYQALDADAKRRAKLAFVAHCAAMADGDADLIAATRERFMRASVALARRRDL